jgi:hypothetical protein
MNDVGRRVAAQRAAQKALQEEIERAERRAEERIRERIQAIPAERRFTHTVDGHPVEVIDAAAVEEALQAVGS